MNNEQERAAFEAWAEQNRYDLSMAEGQYCQTVTRHFWQAWQGRAALAAQQVPARWKLVPVEPTEAMQYAGGAAIGGMPSDLEQADRAYRAMLAAAPQAPAVPKDDLTTRLSRKAEALRDAHPGESAALDVAGLLDEAVSALSAPQAPAVPQRDDADRLLREVFALCEATEDAPEVNAKNEHQKGFDRGRRFEAKQIRRAVGAWFQDEFCGRSFMGEPTHWMPLPAAPGVPQPAEPAPLTDAQIDALWVATPEDPDGNDFVAFARAIEAAHGIRAAGVKEPPNAKVSGAGTASAALTGSA